MAKDSRFFLVMLGKGRRAYMLDLKVDKLQDSGKVVDGNEFHS